ncbi:hypothetical protein C266_04164 [Pandoraea sp. SD6-2]|nr:hypothetical protein C266_04164 [Pandoraea sp. SD6-2]
MLDLDVLLHRLSTDRLAGSTIDIDKFSAFRKWLSVSVEHANDLSGIRTATDNATQPGSKLG